jgi:hypothetical protein
MSRQMSKLRPLIPAVAAVLVILAWYLLFQRPHSGQAGSLGQQKAALIVQHKELQSQLEVARALAGDLHHAQSEWRQLTRGLVVPDSAEQLVEILQQVAADHDVTILQSGLTFDDLLQKVADGTAVNPIERVDLTITGRGRFFSICRFLSALDQQVIVAGVQDIDLTYRAAVDPEVYFDLNLQVFVLTTDGSAG